MPAWLAPLLEFLFALAGLVLAPLLGVLLKRQLDRVGLLNDAQVRGYLDAALSRAVEFGLAEARRKLGVPRIHAEDTIGLMTATDLAAAYAGSRVPDALRRFKVDQAGLEEMIRARLPGALAWQGGATASLATAQPGG